MDRVLKRGCIGLAMAWLQCEEPSKQCHDLQKVVLSSSLGLEQRQAGREKFIELAAARGGQFNEILEREFELRGSRDEPPSIRCIAPIPVLG